MSWPRGPAILGLIVSAVVALGGSTSAWAAAKTWLGTTSSDWSTAANWSPAGVPTTTGVDTITVTGANPLVIAANVSVASFTLDAGFSSTVTSSGSINIDVEGDFVMQAGTFTAPVGRLFIGGRFNKTGGTFNNQTGSNVILMSATSRSHNFNNARFQDLTISEGLVAYWKMDESGPGSIVDSSGFGNHGTQLNTPTFSSVSKAPTSFSNANAIVLAGASRQAVQVPSYSDRLKSSSFTVSAWIKTTQVDPDGGGGTVNDWSEIINAADDFKIRLYPDGTAAIFVRHSGGSIASKYSSSTVNLLDGNWHSVIGVITPAQRSIYVDGVSVLPEISNITVTHNGGDLFIGRHPTSANYDFYGSMDDVRIYNRALSLDQIAALARGNALMASRITQTAEDNLFVDGTLSGLLRGGSGSTITLYSTVAGRSLLGDNQPFRNLTLAGSGSWTLGERLALDGVLTVAASLNAASYPIKTGGLVTSGGATFTAGTSKVTLVSDSNQTLGVSDPLNDLQVEQVRESNLVGYWKFDELTGTTLRDESANRNHGTLLHTAATTSTGLPSTLAFTNTGALTLSNTSSAKGSMALMGASGLPDAGDPQSVSLWFYCSALPASSPEPRYLLTLSVNNPSSSGILITQLRSTGRIEIQRDNGAIMATTTSAPSLGQWHHLVYAYDGGTGHKIYIDGTLQTTTGSPTDAPGTITAMVVGAYVTNAWNFGGLIDEVRIYNVELSQSEISALAAGAYAGRGATSTVTLGANATVNGALTIDRGTLATSTNTLAVAGAVTARDGLTISAGGAMNTGAGAVAISKPLSIAGNLTTGAGAVTLSDTLTVAAGGALTTGAGTVSLTKAATINGTYAVGAGPTAASESFTVNHGGTLRMNSAGGELRMAANRSLIIDGTLVSSVTSGARPKITSLSGVYPFKVGSLVSATPRLDLNGLEIWNTDTDGMYVNAVAGANTTFVRFDNVDFKGTGTAGSTLLQLAASANTPLSLFATGLTFNTANTTYNVKAVDRDGDGNDVRVEIIGTCTPVGESDCEANDLDGDSGSDDRPDDVSGAPAGGAFSSIGGLVDNDGPVVAWNRGRAFSDTAGQVVGYPTIAFSWTGFAYHATYVAYNNANGTKDRLYKRAADGTPVGAPWELDSGEDFVGQPRWSEVAGVWYVFVLTSNGTVYKLRDEPDNSGFTKVWQYRNDTTNSTGTSPLALDANNVYWVGKGAANTPKIFSLKQTATPADDQTSIDASGLNGSGDVVAGTAAPTVATVNSSGRVFFATAGNIYRYSVSGWTPNSVQPTDPSLSTVHGRLSVLEDVAYFVDDTGRLFAVNTDLSPLWTYKDAGNGHGGCGADGTCRAKNLFVNRLQGYVYFGDADGHVYAVKRTGSTDQGQVVATGYPVSTGAANVFEAMPHYRNGIIALGSTGGRIVFIDQARNASGEPAIASTYQLSAGVAALSFDATAGRYVAATADGKLYYIPAVEDPTPDYR